LQTRTFCPQDLLLTEDIQPELVPKFDSHLQVVSAMRTWEVGVKNRRNTVPKTTDPPALFPLFVFLSLTLEGKQRFPTLDAPTIHSCLQQTKASKEEISSTVSYTAGNCGSWQNRRQFKRHGNDAQSGLPDWFSGGRPSTGHAEGGYPSTGSLIPMPNSSQY